MAEACKKKSPIVTFSDGRKFTIQYEKCNSLAWKEYDCCFVKPADGKFVPCGWFHIKFLLTNGNSNE